VMRRFGLPEPYEQLKASTRGKVITQQLMQDFIQSLDLPADQKAALLALTPGNYTGMAAELAARI